MRENNMFKVGDKVEHLQGVGKVVYGPFQGLSGFEPRYLIEKEGGGHFTGSESYLKPVPRFEVGQVVRTSHRPGLFKVQAGPFRWEESERLFYVLEAPEGGYGVSSEEYLTPVVE